MLGAILHFMFLSTLAIALVLQPRSLSEPAVGASIYGDCKVSLAIANKNIIHPSNNEFERAINCLSYLHGFLDGYSWTKTKRICVPDATNIQTVAQRYVQFVDQHPSMKSHGTGEVQMDVLFALANAYPCAERD